MQLGQISWLDKTLPPYYILEIIEQGWKLALVFIFNLGHDYKIAPQLDTDIYTTSTAASWIIAHQVSTAR